MGKQKYISTDWRYFIDSSKRNLKYIFLRNSKGQKYGTVPIGYSTKMKEEYENIKAVLRMLKYNEHQWIKCVAFKMVNLFLGLQSGFTKVPCFLGYWNSRNKASHWTVDECPNRTQLTVGEINIINPPLFDREKIIFPPLHIILGSTKQFVKALDKSERCFVYICSAYPGLSIEKKKSCGFDAQDQTTLATYNFCFFNESF